MNEEAIKAKDGSRIMSVYETRRGTVWIITEGLDLERVTTILLPDEY